MNRRPRPLWLMVALLIWPVRLAAQDKSAPVEVELENLRPGLVATYRSLTDRAATITRIDAKPAFALGHSSPHPRLPAGPFEVVWQGVLLFVESAPVSFDAYVCGSVKVEIDGVTVLEGSGSSETSRIESKQPLERERGLYRLKITYRSQPEQPARLQIGWQSKGFSREPLPAWLLTHVPAERPAAVVQEELATQGKLAIGKLGCARCHHDAFPGVSEPPPGPALHDLHRRVSRDWLLAWLANPEQLRHGARMPALFSADRQGLAERWLIAEQFLGKPPPPVKPPLGDHRLGRRTFISIGCAACHQVPDLDAGEQRDFDRQPLVHLADRLPADELAAFLGNPLSRYPDGRMPRLPLTPEAARDVAAYLLSETKPIELPATASPSDEELAAVRRRLGVRSNALAGAALLRDKGCADCHPGLGATGPASVPLKAQDDSKGCLSDKSLPRFSVDAETRKAIAAYRSVAAQEKHPSPFAGRQRQIERAGCVRCHQRDSDQPPPLEVIGSTLGGAYLQFLPFQRTPRLTHVHQKYTRGWLVSAVREGVTGLRPRQYTYRMPSFGAEAEALVQALAEADGELPAGVETPPKATADPTLGTLAGLSLIGFQGYACVSCHVWNGQMLNESDPGAVGPDLTRVNGRIRRDWFERFLEDPARSHPRTPMPAVFRRGQQALLTSVLDGDQGKQADALWSYLTLGKEAPSPKPPPPLPVTEPRAGEAPLVAQIPIRPPGSKTALEGIAVLTADHDLLVYDLSTMTPHSFLTGGRILRTVQGRLRTYSADGTPLGSLAVDAPIQLAGGDKTTSPTSISLHGYDRLTDGVRLRWQARFADVIEVVETLRVDAKARRLVRELQFTGVPADHAIALRARVPDASSIEVVGLAKAGKVVDGVQQVSLTADAGKAAVTLKLALPASRAPPALDKPLLTALDKIEGALERPGYRAIQYPRPTTVAGGDLLMPAAVAVHPRTGKVYVASMKAGEIFVLNDPSDNGKSARFDNYARGLYQEAYSLLAEDDALYVLHRRNLTRLVDVDQDGVADRYDRVAALPHGIADSYDYGYGLVRDRTGGFVLSYAPYANTGLAGSGGAVRLLPGKPPQEIGYGFRNPIGWCVGPDREVFFTDNQGEWVATNKLSHLGEGRFHGFPNPAQRQHAQKPMAKAAVWVPYSWARSINGVTYDATGGKFGPFAGQVFMAELMFGGAIIRASLEKVNGEYQGACFPFWGKGLLGPVSLAFDPKGRLFVGGITEPGWMAMPDRGALFRLDFTGQTPFEMQSIHARPQGFRIVFTTPVAAESARALASYQVEHYRYEYTGAYGSPELDRTRVKIEKVAVAADGRSAELTTAALVPGRVYFIQARGVRSAQGEPLVHPAGAYTLNEIPRE